ncbi:hypothetical protein CP532_0686 [Ophiocordyceps camponoti-leonardi (nom. inval.)]|nr:hypothetical protein CP532_0686 [Ophiocordyceps camponoti-leonardi (nom. inval.)]
MMIALIVAAAQHHLPRYAPDGNGVPAAVIRLSGTAFRPLNSGCRAACSEPSPYFPASDPNATLAALANLPHDHYQPTYLPICRPLDMYHACIRTDMFTHMPPHPGATSETLIQSLGSSSLSLVSPYLAPSSFIYPYFHLHSSPLSVNLSCKSWIHRPLSGPPPAGLSRCAAPHLLINNCQ